MIFSKKSSITRIFFATDIHGSDTCWRKFLNSAKHYDAHVLILGGDMTGKALVPIVGDGHRWEATLSEVRHDLEGEDELVRFEETVSRRGYYPFRTDPEQLKELETNGELRDELWHEHMLGRVRRWLALAEERLGETDIQCFVCPGNDDQFEVDEIISASSYVELAEGRVVELDGFQMVSTGWANRTPWDTYREEDEPQLAERIGKIVAQVTAPPERTIYSLHCPPYGTRLDDAPELTEDLRPKHGGRSTLPRGSTAVREAIEKGQPLLSLHGHIHESKGSKRLGKTLCINPGSSYEEGNLMGAVIDLDEKSKVKRFVLTNG